MTFPLRSVVTDFSNKISTYELYEFGRWKRTKSNINNNVVTVVDWFVFLKSVDHPSLSLEYLSDVRIFISINNESAVVFAVYWLFAPEITVRLGFVYKFFLNSIFCRILFVIA